MDLVEKRLLIWWVALVALTLVSFEGAARLFSSGQAATAITLIAFIKLKIVISEFMDVRDAPTLLRTAIDIWILVVFGILTAMFNDWIRL